MNYCGKCLWIPVVNLSVAILHRMSKLFFWTSGGSSFVKYINVNNRRNFLREKKRDVCGLQVMEINSVFSSSYPFPATSVLSSVKMVTKEVQNCALLAKYCWGGYTPCLYLYVQTCAPVKYHLSNYRCILHVKIQQYAFNRASGLDFVCLATHCFPF